jgi:DNA repair protein RecO
MSLVTQVQGLVLRKFDYSETSLIFVLLTADRGQLRFIMKGARKGSKKKFPAIDLFRHVSIHFADKSDVELHSIRSCDLVEPFDALATKPREFRAAAWLCRFMERNTMPEENCSQQYQAMLGAFRRLLRGDSPLGVCTSTLFSSLDEHGLLPDLDSMPEKRDAMEYLLGCATDCDLPLPNYGRDDWRNLFDWTVSFAREVELQVPGTDRLR